VVVMGCAGMAVHRGLLEQALGIALGAIRFSYV